MQPKSGEECKFWGLAQNHKTWSALHLMQLVWIEKSGAQKGPAGMAYFKLLP